MNSEFCLYEFRIICIILHAKKLQNDFKKQKRVLFILTIPLNFFMVSSELPHAHEVLLLNYSQYYDLSSL